MQSLWEIPDLLGGGGVKRLKIVKIEARPVPPRAKYECQVSSSAEATQTLMSVSQEVRDSVTFQSFIYYRLGNTPGCFEPNRQHTTSLVPVGSTSLQSCQVKHFASLVLSESNSHSYWPKRVLVTTFRNTTSMCSCREGKQCV